MFLCVLCGQKTSKTLTKTMKKLKSCLSLFLKIAVILIGILSITVYFLTREKPYEGNHSPTQGKTVTIFLIDGLSKSIFNDLLKQEKLPHLQGLIQKSTFVEHGIGAFPSMTGYAFYPFITGVDATKSGILGLRWFDRRRNEGNLRHYVGRTNIHMNEDIHALPKNLFEQYDSFYTASINSYMNRGAYHSEMTGWAHTTSKYQDIGPFKWLKNMPFIGKKATKDHFQHETQVMEMAKKQLKRNPKVQWVTFPSPDASNHIHGTTAEYFQLLSHIDSLIGSFMEEVKRQGQGENRMICVVTDHGISDVSQNLDIPSVLQQKHGISLIRGEATYVFISDLSEKLEDFKSKHGYFVINGNLSAYIYLRDPVANPTIENWRQRQPIEILERYPNGSDTINLIKTIADTEGVELVACRKNDSTVSIFNGQGRGDIIFNKKGFKYQFFDADPLNYDKNELLKTILNNKFHTADEWLKASLETDYPDAIYRLYQLVMAENMGDMVIVSQKGYDLAANYEMFVGNYRGGHGGLRSELLDVPYILYNPHAKPQRLPYLRAEDVGLYIANYLKN